MTHLHTVVAAGRYNPRWFYPERQEGICYVGRLWTHRHHAPPREPHWSLQQHRVSIRAIDCGVPAELKPEPPAEAAA